MINRWKTVKWGDLATLEYGKSLAGYVDSEGDYPVYGTNGQIGWHSTPLSNKPGVIIGRKGAYRGIHYSKLPFFVIDTAFYLNPVVDLDMRWAYYQLLTQNINAMDSGSAIPSTSRQDFYSLPVNLPPLPEQRAIAGVLGALDDKIELNRRMNRILESIAQALFKEWFVDNPEAEGWEHGSLGDSFILTMGQSPPGSTYNTEGNGLPFFQGRADFTFRYPKERVYCTEPTRFAEPGDTLVSVRAPVGDMNMAKEKCAIGRGVAAVRHKTGSRSYTYYAMNYIKSDFLHFEAEGTVFGSINKVDFLSLKLKTPSNEKIIEFEKLCEPIDQLIENNEEQSVTLADLRDTLLPRLMRGDVRVKDVA